ncbi:hypothetical protein KC19_4G073000 [Ceratodon purpureus]|nr:hypothetical protein KC19_4G073000 [Ceratodon purpureus]
MMAAKQAHFGVHRSSCSSSCSSEQSVVGGGLQNFEVGSMEGLRETEVFPLLLNDPCGSSVTEGPSKRGKVSGHISEKKFQGNGGGPRAAAILLTLCLLFSSPNVDASSYRGVSKHKNSKFFHCETEYFGSLPRKKIYFGKFETEKMAALACDVAFFYTGMPSAKFNFKWSEEVILNFCKQRSFYADLTNWDDRRRFIEAQANILVLFVPDFHWEDIILVPTPVPTTVPITPRQRSEWIAGRIVHHFRNQPWRVQGFMAWFMEPSTERRILEVHAQKSSSATHDTILGAPEVDLVWPMNRNDIITGVESLEARPGRNLCLLLIFGGALPFIFKLFESKRAGGEYGGVDDVHVGDTALTDGDSRRSWARIVKKQKLHHLACDYFNSDQALLTAIHYHTKNKELICTGFDLHSKTWISLPSFTPAVPAPDEDLVREYSVCGHRGLMCADVAKSGEEAQVVVFNPLTRKTLTLPPLLYPRRPVLVHLLVDSENKSYKVIAAGSSTYLQEHGLSKKMEVFDSKTLEWEEAPDLPGPAYGLNEYQTGVCVDGILHFITFLEDDCGKGVVAFDVENRKWLDNRTCPIPLFSNSDILQLVENDGKVYLFSEQETSTMRSLVVEHCIDLLEISNPEVGPVAKCRWKQVVRTCKQNRGLSGYPEYTCVSFGDGKLCVFNTLERDGVEYDMQDGSICGFVQPPSQDESQFFSLNPASFMLQLSIATNPEPPNAGSDPVLQITASGGSVPCLNGTGNSLPPSNEASDPLPPSNETTDQLPPSRDSDLAQPTVGGFRSLWSWFGF